MLNINLKKLIDQILIYKFEDFEKRENKLKEENIFILSRSGLLQ